MSTTHGPLRWGTHFKNGKLYVFTKKSVTVVRPWPELRAWRLTAGRRQWRPIRPEINVSSATVSDSATTRKSRSIYEPPLEDEPIYRDDPALTDEPLDEPVEAGESLPAKPRIPDEWFAKVGARNEAAAREFFSHFPQPALELVAAFRERQWHLLVLHRRCPGAADLIRTNPALAFCLASNWVFRAPAPKQPLRDARTWIRRRQRDLAGWLGFPATEQTVNLLRKIPAEACHITALLYLRQALRESDVASLLRHFQRLDATILRLACDPNLRTVVAPKLLWNLSALAPSPAVISRHVRTLLDLLELAKTLVPPREVPACDSVRQLIRNHDRMAAELNQQGLAGLEFMQFPPPPIPGTETIVPLTGPVMLLEEGRLQMNCVASFVRRVARGNEFIYRVLATERATLQLVLGRQGWQIGQLSGPRNQPVSATTRLAVENWIAGDGLIKNWTQF